MRWTPWPLRRSHLPLADGFCFIRVYDMNRGQGSFKSPLWRYRQFVISQLYKDHAVVDLATSVFPHEKPATIMSNGNNNSSSTRVDRRIVPIPVAISSVRSIAAVSQLTGVEKRRLRVRHIFLVHQRIQNCFLTLDLDPSSTVEGHLA